MIFIVQMFECHMGEFYSKTSLIDRSKKTKKNVEEMRKICLEEYFKVKNITEEIEQEDEEDEVGPGIDDFLNSGLFQDIRDDRGNFKCSENEMKVIAAIMCREAKVETRHKEFPKRKVKLREFLKQTNEIVKQGDDKNIRVGFYHAIFRGSGQDTLCLQFEGIEKYNENTFLEIEYWDARTCEFTIDGIYFGLLDAKALKMFPTTNQDSSRVYPVLQESVGNVLNILEETELTNMGKVIILYQIFYYAELLMRKMQEKEKEAGQKDNNIKENHVVSVFELLNRATKDFPMDDIVQVYRWLESVNKERDKKKSKDIYITKDRIKQINEYIIRRCCECQINSQSRGKEVIHYNRIVEAVYRHQFSVDDTVDTI